MRVSLSIVQVFLDRLSDHHEDFRGLVHQLRETKIANALLGEVVRAHTFNALKLTKMGGVSEQIEEQ